MERDFLSPYSEIWIPGINIWVSSHQLDQFFLQSISKIMVLRLKPIVSSISSCSMKVLFNEEPLPALSPTQGLCQGDPLSPFLFILVSECLSLLIGGACRRNLLHGTKLARGTPFITHSLFVNDVIFFVKGSVEDCSALRDILHTYCHASGQIINFNKSCIVFSSNCPPVLKDNIFELFNIPMLDSLVNILVSLLIGVRRKNRLYIG